MAVWDRESLRKDIWLLLGKSKNIGLFANRRLGKTYLMQQFLLEEAEEYGFAAVYCDLQGEQTCEAAVSEIIKDIQVSFGAKEMFLTRLKAKLRETAGAKREDVSVQSMVTQVNWKDMFFTVLKEIDQNSEKKYLIMLDEVTVCLADIFETDESQGREFLNTLRKARMQFKNIVWLLTGSIGIDNIADLYEMSGAINDLEPVPMNPLTADEAKAFASHLASNATKPYKFEANTLNALLQRIGWLSPYYIEQLCTRIELSFGSSNDDPTPITLDKLDKSLQSLLEYPNNRVFKIYPDNIDRHYAVELKSLSRKILSYLSKSSDGEAKLAIESAIGGEFSQEAIERALKVLQDDGYLTRDADGVYRFLNTMLCAYWAQNEA